MIEQAATILILLIQREIAEQKARAQYRDEFVQDLLYENINSEEEIQNRARLYHWDFGAGGLVVIVDVDDYKLLYNKDYNMDISRIQEEQRQLIFAVAKRIMMKYFTQVVYSYLSDQIVFILSETDYEKDKLLKDVYKRQIWSSTMWHYCLMWILDFPGSSCRISQMWRSPMWWENL